jgi:hypothetical protein
MARRRRRNARAWRTGRRGIALALWTVLLIAAAYGLYLFGRSHPEDLPWTDLDLAQPVGLFTRSKLVGLHDDFPQCRILMERAGVAFEAAPVITAERGQCGYANGVRLLEAGARTTPFNPNSPAVQCQVAAAIALWEWHVVQPAARRHMKTSVAGYDQLGSYNCRRMYGRPDGAWSEHATANAIDISGFRFADGRRVTLKGDWNGTGPDAAAKAAFLREVRDGACDLFSTVLSPDYNAAHADHFHLDQAERGAMRGGACR